MEEESSILVEYFSESISALPLGISCIVLCNSIIKWENLLMEIIHKNFETEKGYIKVHKSDNFNVAS